jgi:hypothetical protein
MRRRRLPVPGLLLAIAAGAAGTARGDDSLGALDDSGQERRDVKEIGHEVEILVRGALAEVTVRQTFVNGGSSSCQLVYGFDLPAAAVVVAASATLGDGRSARSTAVATRAVLRSADAADPGDRPDPLLLRLVARDPVDVLDTVVARGRHELRLYPLVPGRATAVTTRWLAPLRYDDGRLTLRLPERGAAPELAGRAIAVRGVPDGTLAAPGQLWIGGRPVAPGERLPAGNGELDIAASPSWRDRSQPVVHLGLDRSSPARAAGVLSVLVPPATAALPRPYRRVLFLVDTSHSMGAAGAAAAAAVLGHVLGGVPEAAAVQLVTFARRAQQHPALAGANQASLRSAMRQHLSTAAQEGGSALGAGLDAVRPLLAAAAADAGSPTLLCIVSDGLTPRALTEQRAREHLGPLPPGVDLLAVVLVPDEAPRPDPTRGPLAALARAAARGRSVVLRHGELASRGPQLLTALHAPAPLSRMRLVAGQGRLRGALLPEALAPGEGALVTFWLHGPGPVTLTALDRDAERSLRPRTSPALQRAALALALRFARPGDALLDGARDPAADGEELRALQQLEQASHLAGAVTPYSSLVGLDPRDGFARDRLALARRWGLHRFVRLAPGAERLAGLRPYEQRSAALPLVAGSHRTGELDSALLQQWLRRQLLPAARACARQAAPAGGPLRGHLLVALELARGEVQAASIARSTVPELLARCVMDAAYALQPPAPGPGTAEPVILTRYPLHFGPRADRPAEVTDDTHPPAPVDGDPLGGLPPFE